MPLQLSDLVTLFKILDQIHKYSFEPVHSAAVACSDLRDDVDGFESTLRKLDTEVKALQRNESQRRHQHEEALTDTDIHNLFRSCQSTLRECRDLLSENYARIEKYPAPIVNMRFGRSGKDEVARLQNRLQAHESKLLVLLKPYEMRQARRAGDTVDELRQIMTRQFPESTSVGLSGLPIIDALAAAHMLDSWQMGPHEDDDRCMELLQLHVDACVAIPTEPNGSASLDKKLTLMRAYWIHSQLSQRQTLASPGSAHRRNLISLGEDIKAQFTPCGIVSWDDDDLTSLDTSTYSLWPSTSATAQPVLGGPSNLSGTLLVTIPLVTQLPGQEQTLSVLKVEDGMRQVLLKTMFAGGNSDTDRSRVDVNTDKVVPFYASSNMAGAVRAWTLSIFERTRDMVCEFKTVEELSQVQQAFTGYSVPFRFENAGITIERPGKLRSNLEQWTGEMQFWWHGADPWAATVNRRRAMSISGSSTRAQSPLSGADNSQNSQIERLSGLSSMSNLSTVAASFTTFDSSIITVANLGDDDEYVLAQLSPPPMLVGLCKDAKRYCMWAVKMMPTLTISEQTDIRRSGRVIYRLGLERTTSRSKLRTLTKDTSHLQEWDLLSLLRTGKSPSRDRQTASPFAENEDFKSLILDFNTAEERRKFVDRLKWIVTEYRSLAKQLKAARDSAQNQANRPRRQTESSASIVTVVPVG